MPGNGSKERELPPTTKRRHHSSSSSSTLGDGDEPPTSSDAAGAVPYDVTTHLMLGKDGRRFSKSGRMVTPKKVWEIPVTAPKKRRTSAVKESKGKATTAATLENMRELRITIKELVVQPAVDREVPQADALELPTPQVPLYPPTLVPDVQPAFNREIPPADALELPDPQVPPCPPTLAPDVQLLFDEVPEADTLELPDPQVPPCPPTLTPDIQLLFDEVPEADTLELPDPQVNPCPPTLTPDIEPDFNCEVPPAVALELPTPHVRPYPPNLAPDVHLLFDEVLEADTLELPAPQVRHLPPTLVPDFQPVFDAEVLLPQAVVLEHLAPQVRPRPPTLAPDGPLAKGSFYMVAREGFPIQIIHNREDGVWVPMDRYVYVTWKAAATQGGTGSAAQLRERTNVMLRERRNTEQQKKPREMLKGQGASEPLG